jgi:peptidoglycan hydrolase-like protein with peptidoglycan-binding domain
MDLMWSTGALAVAAAAAVAVGVVAGGTAQARDGHHDDFPAPGVVAAPKPAATADVVTVTKAPQPRPKRQPKPAASPTPALPPAGPVLIRPGDSSPQDRELQARLRQIAWFYGDVTDYYGDQTVTAVKGFQAKRGYPASGVVDRRTLTKLEEMSAEPTQDELHNVKPDPADGAALDPRCTSGRVLCIDKTSNSLRWVVDGDVKMTLDARFGASDTPTREGEYAVYWKDPDHVSKLYGSSMPYAMFFSGGQAVHYSSDFASVGYAGASHGCVNIRDYDGLAHLYSQVQVGDTVVVYWS